jgi:hypothetical protein
MHGVGLIGHETEDGMKRHIIAVIAACALGVGALPAKATTISTDTFGSTAHVAVTTIPDGELKAGHTFNLIDFLTYIPPSTGSHYGQVFTYIPFSVAKNQTFTATMTDLLGSNGANISPEWANIELFQYTGDDYLGCGNGSALCSAVPNTYSAGLPSSIYANLVGGVEYLLKIGYGLCGCVGDIGGIQLSATVTPIPPAMLMLLTALAAMGGIAWRRGFTNRSGAA